MSYPGSLPPGHPFPAGNVGSSRPPGPQGNEYSSGSQSQHGCVPPFKRPRNQDDHTPDSAAFIPMKPRTIESQPNPLLNKGTGNIFYKTRMCAKFVGGYCINGENCTFAHGFEDLREPPPNWKEYVHANGKGAGVWDKDQRTIRGLKICRKFFYEKECPYGEKCNFLHEISPYKTEMARPVPMNISSSLPSINGTTEQRNDTGKTRINKQFNAGSDALLVNRRPVCLKTKICTRWESTGQCPFKENCYYAHGQSELMRHGIPEDSSISTNNVQQVLAAAPTQVTETNKLLTWRPPRKIAGIYGDWLDGHNLSDNN